MTFAAIILMTLLNLATAVYALRRYAHRETSLQFMFVIVWTVHYVLGSTLVLLSSEYTYTMVAFSEFETGYLLAQVAGQYFLWVYLFLLDSVRRKPVVYQPLRATALPFIILFLGLCSFFGLLLILQIGPDLYFSPELAIYRARLGELSAGVGYFYYLATFLISATLIAAAYALSNPRPRNYLIVLGALVVCAIVFVPLGGRGRIVNILLVIALAYVLTLRNFSFQRLLDKRLVGLVAGVFILSLIWGRLRESAEAQLPTSFAEIVYVYSVDTTRLQFQAFAFERFPAFDLSFGTHYVESFLGPFYAILSLEPVGLITNFSSAFYGEVIGAPDLQSAISPSFIGEAYLTLGVLGVILAPLLFFLIIQLARTLARAESAMSLAVIIYFFQFNMFHGGLYLTFDTLVVAVPVLLICNWLTAKARPQVRRSNGGRAMPPVAVP